MFFRKVSLAIPLGIFLWYVSGCERENVVHIESPTGFPIVLEYPGKAEGIFGDDNSVHFLIEDSRITLFLATEESQPEIVKQAEAADVNEIEGVTILEEAVRFGQVSGTRWRLKPSETTYYLLDAPGNYVGIKVTHSEDEVLSALEESLPTLHVEHLP